MTTVFFVLISLFIFGLLLLIVTFLLRKKIPLPDGQIIYSDSAQTPGETIKATSLPLVGKPDYILKKNDDFIPIEIKTGKTPTTPYKNHVAQLFAYCLLLEEHFGKRPPYGIIRYPDREIPLEYPTHAEDRLEQIVNEMLQKKQSGEHRSQMNQVCRKCREGAHSDSLDK